MGRDPNYSRGPPGSDRKEFATKFTTKTDKVLRIGRGLTVVLTMRPSLDYTNGFASHASSIIIDNDLIRPRCLLLLDNQFHLCLPATNGSASALKPRPTCCIGIRFARTW